MTTRVIVNIIVEGVGTYEDVLRCASGKIKSRNKCVLSDLVVNDVLATTVESECMVILERKFDKTLVLYIFYCRLNVVGECCSVTDVIEALLSKSCIALSAFSISLSIVKENLSITEVIPRVL